MARLKNVIIEMDYTPDLQDAALNTRQERGPAAGFAAMGAPDAPALSSMPGFRLDAEFGVVQVPAQAPGGGAGMDARETQAAIAPEQSTYIVRGVIDEDQLDYAAAAASAASARVFSDPVIEPCLICPGSPPLGNDATVARLLCVPSLASRRMDGFGVMVAVVDTGFNLAYLRSRGRTPIFDFAKSWVPRPGLIPGSMPVNHGTMCAFDATIAAPRATLLDIAVLASTRTGGSAMDGLLSDAVLAYSFLLRMFTQRRPGDPHSLVVSNSWGMFNPSWDFPVGHPGNYSDNPNHPFNRIVGSLNRAGADILFAAGNCGRDCPDGRCGGLVTGGIYGANSHPDVLSIGGVDTNKDRVGYSTSGPGHLVRPKPDICGYTHFQGSRVYPADGGTSAATPVVAGVLAAFRSRFPYDASDPLAAPANVRDIFRKTAEHRGAPGFNFDYGFGIVNGCKLAAMTRLTADVESEPVESSEAGWPDADHELAELEAEISVHEATDAGAWSGGSGTAAAQTPTASPAARQAEDAGGYGGAEAGAPSEPSYTAGAPEDESAGFEGEAAAPPPGCAQHVANLKRVIALANQNAALRRCLAYHVCKKGPKPDCSRTALQLVSSVNRILQTCPQFRIPFCKSIHA
jgi:hypothetical protein